MNMDPRLEPRLDVSILEQIRQLGAIRPGLLPRLIRKFQESTEEFLASTMPGENRAPVDRMRMGFHTLKGTAASLGAARLSALAWQVEHALSTGTDPDSLRTEIEAVRAEFAESIRELQDYVRASA